MARSRLIDKQHRWLSLVEISGVVLSEPVLVDAAPTGFRSLEKPELAAFYKAKETWDLPPGMLTDPQGFWTEFILGKVLELLPKYWVSGAAIPKECTLDLPAYGETLRPTRILMDGTEAVMLFVQLPREQGLDSAWLSTGGWKASPTTKVDRLLRAIGVQVALVTNGELWRLIVASPAETMAHLTWSATTWAESPYTLAAFKELLGASRFFAGPKSGTILSLCQQSRMRQIEITDQLGVQVRGALECLISEVDAIDQQSSRQLLKEYSLQEIFEASVAFMMRLLFLFYAEENQLFPHGEVDYDRSYGLIHLLQQLENQYRIDPLSLTQSHDAYARLLALFRLTHEGSSDSNIHINPYGGQLFDAERFPLLEGRHRNGDISSLTPLPVSNSTVRDILRSLKYVLTDASKQWVSYRMLAVEQIGYMYESLLGYEIARNTSDAPIYLLDVKDADTLVFLTHEELTSYSNAELIDRIQMLTGKTKPSISRIIEPIVGKSPRYPLSPKRNDSLPEAAKKLSDLLKQNAVVEPEGIYLAPSQLRHSKGINYTRPQLTEPIVRYCLEALVSEESASAQDVLQTKVCDITMGSGAFLVQAVRYLSKCLVAAWESAIRLSPGIPLTMPFAEPAVGVPSEHLLPGSGSFDPALVQDPRAEMNLWAKRYVLDHCIFGIDINHLAVEMAKLSLWLETLSKGRPFTFLDHALKCGNTLLGLTDSGLLSSWLIHKNSGDQLNVLENSTQEILNHVIELRVAIANTPVLSVRDEKLKAKILQEADSSTALLRLGADLLIAEHFGGETATERESLHRRFSVAYTTLGQKWKSEAKKQMILQDPSFIALRTECDEILKDNHPFHWILEFPEVFLTFDFSKTGFSAIIGNPPFGNAIEASTSRSSAEKNWYKNQWPIISKGAYDKVNLFIARSIQLLSTAGRYGLIQPRTNLSASSAIPLQEYVNKVAPPQIIISPDDSKLFSDATVFISAIIGTKEAPKETTTLPVNVSTSADLTNFDFRISTLRVPWWASVESGLHIETSENSSLITFGDVCSIKAGATTSVAYELRPEIEDNEYGAGLKLVTTGLIDRYEFKWGSMKVRFLKSDFAHPRWPVVGQAISRGVNSAAAAQSQPKVLVAGLVNRLEAAADLAGEFAGVVATFVVSPKDLTLQLPLITALLNSWIFSRLYLQKFGGKEVGGGGYWTIGKQELLSLPIPRSIGEEVATRQNLLKFLDSAGKPADDAEFQEYLCSLYGIVGTDFEQVARWYNGTLSG